MRGRFLFLLSAVLSLTVGSCSLENEVSTSSEAVITSFTMGYYKVAYHDLNVDRRDTIIYITEGGVMYPMTIDQLNNRIYNTDSLTYGSIINAVTSTVYTKGTLFYSYADDPETTYLWSGSDSLDFTRKMFFIVVSTDGTYTRTYSLDVNVSKVFADSVKWTERDSVGFPLMTELSSVVRKDTIYCFGKDSQGAASVSFRDVVHGKWNGSIALSGLPSDGWITDVMVCNGSFYTVSGGVLYASETALDWKSVKTGIKSLLVSNGDYGELWAVSQDNYILHTTDMTKWDTVQAVPDNFPLSRTNIYTEPLLTNRNIKRSVLTGISGDNPYASVWTKLSVDSVWTSVDMPEKKELRLPAEKNLSVFMYEETLIAVGLNTEWFRQSCDNGVTWYECDSYIDTDDDSEASWDHYMQLPSSFKFKENASTGFTCTVDDTGSIWILNEKGKVWRGAKNRLNKR